MEQRVEAADLDTVHQILSSTYGAMRIEVVGGRPAGMRLASATLGGVRFDRVSFSMAFEADGDPLGAYVFGQLTAGRVGHCSDRCVRHYLPGEVFLAVQPDHRYTAAVDDTAVDLVVIDPSLVDEVAESAPGPGERAVRFIGYRAVSTRATERWKSTYAYVHAEARTGSAGVTHPLVAGNAARLRDAVPGTITVSAVAAQWGFLNPSQFAAHHRTAFAELPSRTLLG